MKDFVNAEAPLVSVLMTAYNREKYIGEAIESVLSSALTNFELIIVDDCSSDNTKLIAENYQQSDKRVKLFANETNLGDYRNRNRAASLAQGKYIKYLDSDDIMYPHCLLVMAGAMEKFPEAGFGLSARGDAAKPYPAILSPREIYLEHFNGYGHFERAPGSAIIKKEVFEQAGGFSGKRYIGDTELWLKLAQKNYMVKFPVDLYWSRLHNSSESVFEQQENIEKVRRNLFSSFLNAPECPIQKGEIKKTMLKTLKTKVKRFL